MDPISIIAAEYQLDDPELIRFIEPFTEIRAYAANDIVFSSDDDKSKLYFVLDGAVRMFTISAKGQEITDLFFWKFGELIVAYENPSSYKNRAVPEEYCEAVLPTTLLSIPVEVIRKAAILFPKVSTVIITEQYERWRNLLHIRHIVQCMTATKRYEWFLEEFPGLIDLIPHKYIASFLGMNPVTMSRIRRARGETSSHRQD